MPSSAGARSDVTPSYLLPLAMDDTIPLLQETKPMDSPRGHPYAQYRKRQSTILPLAAHFPPVPAVPIKDLRLASWHSDSSESDNGPLTAFVSFTGLPSNKRDISPPADGPPPAHGCPYVKHGSGITVILSGHKAGTSFPLYRSGSSISGVVVLSKLENVESFDVKLEGSISVRETQAGFRNNIAFLSDRFMTWNAASTNLPDEFSFRHVLPTFSRDGRLLPPTFDSRLTGIPGFRVSVKWAISVTVTHTRSNPLPLFRRTTRLSVPINYVPRTRPPLREPSPMVPTFVDLVPARREHTPPIHTQIYLPDSQITPMTKTFRFRIVLSAPDAYLKPFHTTPSHCSFLTMGCETTPAEDHTDDPISVRLVRGIGADPRETGVVVVGELATSSTRRRGATLAEGTLGKAEIGHGIVSWWGEMRVRPGTVSAGGFEADGLVVQDELVLALNAPGVQTHAFPFRQTVPIRLTTDLPETSEAVLVTKV